MQPLNISTISPQGAQAKMNGGATLVDVREYPEWIENHISNATLIPLGDIKKDPKCATVAGEVLLLCDSGRRATEAARCLAAAGVTKPFVIEGGIGAGALVLLGLLVPRLRIISYLVPCGLIFSGITDTCGMAKVLAKMPWNQPVDGAQLPHGEHQDA